MLPVSAIEQAEVLRDGAAAQYGSDAIAGVMNFKLKSTPGAGSVAVTAGEYFAGDGDLLAVQFSQGIALGQGGEQRSLSEMPVLVWLRVYPAGYMNRLRWQLDLSGAASYINKSRVKRLLTKWEGLRKMSWALTLDFP